MLDSIKDKIVLITGGSGKIGQAIAKAFKQNGSTVILWGHREIEAVSDFCDFFQVVEMLDISDIHLKFNMLTNNYPNIDVLVNCAGYTHGGKSEEYSIENWNDTIAVNLTAPFVLSQLVANLMIPRKGGQIINITSIGSFIGFPENPAYLASKGGLRQLTKGLALDWGKYGIRVNSVAPGYTKTKMTLGSWNNNELRENRTDRTILGHWAEPEDIVGAVLFLASDMSGYITGQDIVVDGGWSAKGL